MKKYLIIIISILLIILSGLYIKLNNTIKEKNRLSENNTTLMKDFNLQNKQYKIRDSINVYENGRLQLTLKELKEFRKNDLQLIKDLKLKKSEVKTITNTVIETQEKIKFQLRDSCINYNTKWISVNGCIGDTLTVNTTDSISQVLYKDYKFKFWFIRFGLKGVKQKVVNHNPNSKIKFSEYIEIK